MRSLQQLSRAEVASRLAGAGLVLSIPPFHVHLRSPIPIVAEGLHTLYGAHALIEDREVFCDFHLALHPGRGWRGAICELEVDGQRPFTPLARAEAFALFEWGLNWCVTSHCHHWLTVHAAVLERQGRAVVMPAPPGSGKSTLCAWLMHRGWRMLSDELALFDPATGVLTASPRPVSLKNQSIEIIRTRLPAVRMGPLAHDTLKGTVAHLQVSAESLARAGDAAQARWIVFPRFEARAPLSAIPMAKPQALVELASNSFNYHVHGRAGFDCLADIVERCDVLRLNYSDLDEATAWFDALAEAS